MNSILKNPSLLKAREGLKQATDNILFSGDDYLKIKRGTDSLYRQFSEHTGVTAGDLTHAQYIETESGLAVAIEHAAHCLKDIMRTTRFLRGIYLAIEDRAEAPSTVRILYAGCGPYSTLLTPLTSQFTSDQVQFTMMDINPEAMRSTQLLYEKLSLTDYLEDCRVADATSPDLSLQGDYDIIISETMAQALKVECQVPLTRNMVKYLGPNGTFIPQRISVDAHLCGYAKESHPSEAPKVLVGNVYTLDFKKVPEEGYQSKLIIPETSFTDLVLYTSIQIYQSEVIQHHESGLTVPILAGAALTSGFNKINFTYLEGTSCDYEISYDT